MRVARAAVALLAGMFTWALLWNLGTSGAQAAFPDVLAPGVPIAHTGALAGYLAYSVLVSAAAGAVTGLIGRGSLALVWILAVVHLGLGIAAELSYWHLMPAWYHVAFLLLVVPSTLLGARLAGRRARN